MTVLRRFGLAAALTVGLLAIATGAQAQTCTPLNAGGISGLVWFDENGNGIRDAEDLDNGIAGVQVQLLDSSGVVIRTVTTSAGVGSILGSYAFTPLCGGTYTVRLVEATLPAGYVATIEGATPDISRDSSTSPVVVVIVWDPAIGRFSKVFSVDFGFKAGCTGSIGDFVWNDVNQNGVQDDGEPGIPGRQVRLLLNGSVVGTDTTDANGGYMFAGLCPGTYTVQTDTPPGMTASPTVGTPDTALDSDASGVVVPLALNENNPTIDFGFYFPCVGTIGDFVWYDTNRNGVQDGGELGISNVTVELLDGGGAVIQTDITDANGAYLFTGLCAGTYSVRVNADTLPAGYVASPTLQGGDPTLDSNPSPTPVTLPTNNSNDVTIDFGYNAPCAGRLGDFVWNDANANGVQDAGEVGIPNVTVTLFDAGGAVVGVDTTDASGYYLFEGLCGGSFVVEVNPDSLPGGRTGWLASPPNAGNDDLLDSDGIDHRTGASLPNDFADDRSYDFGYYRPQPLTVTKTAEGRYGRTITWDLVKSVDPATHSGVAGQTAGSSTWSVSATKTAVDSGFVVTGEIHVANANGFPVSFSATDALNDGTVATVTCPANEVPAGGSITCSYTASPSNTVATSNTATVQSLTAGVDGGSATVPVVFSSTATGDETVTLGDARFSYSTTISGSSSPTFPESFVCPSDASLYANGSYSFTEPNTATLWGANTNLSADASVRVTCTLPALTVSKTAAGSFDRRFSWQLAKSVAPSSHSGSPGSTFNSTWAVTATKTVVENNYLVSGTITVSNPSAISRTFSVSDVVNGTAASVSCPTYTLAAGAQTVCSYSVAVQGATLNTATVTTAGSAPVSASASVSYTANVIGDNTVTLADPKFTYSTSISATTAPTFPETFTCPTDASKYTNGVYTFTVPNTATLTGANTNLSASATVTVTCRQQWRGETAVGAGTRYPNTSNWFMYSPYTTSAINLVAGQHYDAGDIVMWRASGRTYIRITLHTGWRWANVPEVLKIQPFNTRPTTYLPPGQFLYKFTAPSTSNNANATVSFSGNTVTVSLPGTSAQFYGIHGDVERLQQ